jgi:hypothetical protein
MASFDYTSRDYLSIRQDILDRASSLIPEWTNRNSADFGVVLVDLWAYLGDILHYYIDRAAAETYLGTAINTSSVMALANLFDYRPASQTSAIGYVTLTTSDATHSDTIVIPQNTGFIAPGTDNEPLVYFTTTASASMGASTSSVVVQVAEGKYVGNESPIQAVTRNTYSNGTASQRFNLRFSNVIPSSIVVYVAEGTSSGGVASNVQYFYTSDITLSSTNSKVFGIEIAADGVAQLVFGNGINGKIPNNRAEVTVSYRYGQGASGNLSSGRIAAFDSGSSVSTLSVTSSTAATGGTNSESLESMKTNIPLMFRTQNRAVSLQDFKDLALRVPQVVKATCEVVAGSSSPTEILNYGLPYQSYYLTNADASIPVPSYVKDEIVEYFEPRTLVGASAGAANSVVLDAVKLTATIYVADNAVTYWVKEAVADAIDTFFLFDNVSFGQTLSIGAFYKAIQSIEGVDYVIITAFNNDESGAVSSTITAASNQLFRKGLITLTTVGGITGSLS